MLVQGTRKSFLACAMPWLYPFWNMLSLWSQFLGGPVVNQGGLIYLCYKTIHGVNDLNSNHYDHFEFYTTAHRRFVISTGSCTFIGLWKIHSCLFIPNCTRNHVITYTSYTRLSFITVVWIIDRILTLLTAYSGRLRHLSQRYAMNECRMLWSLKTHLQGTELKQITNQ